MTPWTKPIVVGRHAHADQYKATDFLVPGAGKLTMTFTPEDGGKPVEYTVNDFKVRKCHFTSMHVGFIQG